MKKLLSIALVAAMLFACVATAVPVSAATSGYYEYSVNDDGTTATVTRYKGTQADVVIPSVIDGYTITNIGDYAFEGCTSLESVTIPVGVTSIGYRAFYGCTSLASVTIPSSVTSIGGSAFYDCTSLKSVKIPASVTGIGWAAFSNCSSLTEINVDINNKYYTCEDGVLFNKDKTNLVQYPAGNTRNTYFIPESVTSIEYCTFSGCTSLTSVTIPEGVTSIGDYAFSYCTSLTSVTIPEGVTSIGGGAFFKCTSLESVTIPESVTSIGSWAFQDCTSLASITIPEGVTSIGDYAFSYCTSLTSVTIPDSVTSIGDDAFSGTAYVSNEANWENDVLFIDNHLIKAKSYISGSYNIPEGTKTISGGAFFDCTSLTSVTIPEGVTSIGGSAFSICLKLKSITIPASVTSIGDYAFCNCTSLASVTIHEGVTSIGIYAFWRCTSLASVTIPESVTSIGDDAFSECDNIVIYGYGGTAAEKYASDNNITFIPLTDLVDSESNVTVSGSVPEETQLIVNNITTTDTRVTYDITLLQNGEEIQPEGTVKVKIPVPAGMDGADCRVYREEESGSYTDMNAVYKDGFMVFTTEHFSKYVITSEMLGVVLGDINADGVVTLKDVLVARKYVAGVASLSDEEIYRGDLNGDGLLTLKDVLIMRKMVAGVL